MRLLALGDVHGCFRALTALSEFVPFTPEDVIVALGDYVDRGPNSREVVDWVIARHQDNRCIPLRGNHEVMMLEALAGTVPMGSWCEFGGDRTLASYGKKGEPLSPRNIPEEHVAFLRDELLAYYETDTHIFVHASPDAQLPMNEQDDHALYWDRFDELQPHCSGKTVICGHTAQLSGVPSNRGHGICIDTWVYGRGWLTCLEVASGDYWQANERGQTRRGNVAEL